MNLTNSQREMVRPGIFAGMKQRDDFIRFGIDAAEVRSLVGVAAIASQAKILEIVITSVLLGNNVLDVKGKESGCFLWDQAILAPLAGTPPDSFAGAGVHVTKDVGLETYEP